MSNPVVRSGRYLAALILLFQPACDRGYDRSFSVRDSAGVSIIESQRPSWTDDAAWTVTDSPALSIAGSAPDRRFGRIAGVVTLDDGGIAVADAADFSLHFFDATGRLVHTVQPGDAPIMVRAITRLYRIGGEVHLAQRGMAPTLVFDQAGTFIRAVEPPAVEGLSLIALYRPMDDGSLLAMRAPQRLIPRADEWTENATFFRIPASGGPAERVLSIPGIRYARVPSSVEPVAFGPVLGFAFGSDRLLAGFPDQFDIGEYAPDGTLRRRMRRAWEPVPVEPAVEQALRDSLQAILERTLEFPEDAPELMEEPESRIRELKVATTLPAYGRLILDHTDHLWVERVPPVPIVIAGPAPVRPEPTPWDVFDPAGKWLGTVTTPADTHVMDVADDAVAGISRSLGVTRAVLFRLDRGEQRAAVDPNGS